MSANWIKRLGANLLQRGWLLAAYLVAMPAPAAAPVVSATLEPSQISLGESAQLTLTISGSGMDPVKLPEVAGLELRIVGQSRRISIVNGAMLSSSSMVVRITAQAAGIFTIPGIAPNSEPLVLRVNPEGSPSSAPGNAAGSARPGAGAGIHTTTDGSAFVRLVLPKRDIYVGESVPIDIELGLRDGFAQANQLPTLTGGEFTLNNLSRRPEQANRLVDGKPFTVLTWHTVIAAVKPGKFSLAVESPITVRVRTAPPRESMLNDMLGDPFLQNIFGASVTKNITVTSPPSELTVLELPTEGRPPDFSGAVGSFKIASEISPPHAAAGEPLTLRMHVTGAGNFDRVDSPLLEHLDQWKTYPPKSSFKPGDALGLRGEKTFEQPLIASTPGTQTLPGLTFRYFDPTTRRYETARSEPLTVAISPSQADTTGGPQPPANAAIPAKPPSVASNDGLRPDKVAPAAGTRSLVPLYLRPGFLALPSLLVLGIAGGWLALRRPSETGPGRSARARARSKRSERLFRELETQARAGNAASFFELVRTALVEALAARWRAAPEELTAADIDARLGGDFAAELQPTGAAIRQIFALADEADYAGLRPAMMDFERWTELVRRVLRELDKHAGASGKRA